MATKRFEPQGPVDWALGKVLLETALKPILYSILPDRVDPRDWMRPEALQLAWRPQPTHDGDGVEDYWFDLVADTGDSDVAAYSLAYLFHGDLCVEEPAVTDIMGDEPKLNGATPVRVDPGATGARVLPRGQFLFVGGDTAYPVADSHTICQRFVVPTDYAFARRFGNAPPEPRPLLGIPGNHDWYDNLDGFNRTFRVPTAPIVTPSAETWSPEVPKGHRPVQHASYCALALPGNWQFWAVDARDGSDLDHRQRVHFEEQARVMLHQVGNPSLLLATPNPAYVDGHAASWLTKLCGALPPAALASMRLWFSGDTHHYARYEAVSVPGGVPVTSLVSGLGGAALHAAGAGSAKATHVYPAIATGEASVARRLASPLHMLGRPGLRWAGGVLGACLGVGAISRARPTGEAVPSAEHVVGMVAGAEAPAAQAAVYLVSFLALFLLTSRVVGKPDEKTARGKSVAKRLGFLVFPLVLIVLSLVLIAQGQRTFGDIMLDVMFVLAVFALLGAVPLLLASGQAKQSKSFGRGALLVLIAWLLGAATIGGSVVVASYVDGALLRAGWTDGVRSAARALAAPIAAAALQVALFPILTGFALVPAFLLGTQRAFISSFACIDRYAAFIRFRLRVDRRTQRGRLTGFVIAVKDGVTLEGLRRSSPQEAPVPTGEIIDVFTIGPKGS